MTRTHARAYASYQEPPSPRVVALDAVVGGWWPGLVTHCPHCGSRLRVEPPSGGESGRVYCVQCGRSHADVVQRLSSRPALTRDQLYPRRGRPPGASRTAEQKATDRARQAAYRQRLSDGAPARGRWARNWDACLSCGGTDSRHNARGFCNRCKRRAQNARTA